MNPEDQKKLEMLSKHVRSLPALPSLAREILESINNDNIDNATLAKKIASDLGIVARVMRVANSPFFGLSGQIGSISEAIVVVGMNSLRGLVTSASIINLFPKELENFDLKAFWQHNIRTAVCAKLLAKHVKIDPETAFTAGLLHDIGVLVIAIYYPDLIAALANGSNESSDRTRKTEIEYVGMDHAHIGAEVAKYWHFPEAMQVVIAKHHDPAPSLTNTAFVNVIYTANLLAHVLHNDQIPLNQQIEFTASAKNRLGIEQIDLEAFVVEAKRLYDGAVMLINV